MPKVLLAGQRFGLLIIEEFDLPRYRRWPFQEGDEWKAVPNAFIPTALAEGKLLYEDRSALAQG